MHKLFIPEQDLNDVHGWWEAHGWPALPLKLLPKLGVITEDDGHKYCAGWLYQTDSKVAILEWIVANPNAPRKPRSKAVDLVIETLCKHAKDLGFETIFSSLVPKQERLIKRYETQGFIVSDRDMTNVVKRIEQ